MPYRATYNKYRNKKIEFDGHTFDSRKEYERYLLLKALERNGDITDLECQKKFILIPAQRALDTLNSRGKRIQGKVLERECAYYADFVYYDVKKARFVVEDAKGMRTEVYKIKKKLMLWVHHIHIKEV